MGGTSHRAPRVPIGFSALSTTSCNFVCDCVHNPPPISSFKMSPKPNPRVFTYTEFDLGALCRSANSLRQGIPCACDSDPRPASGSFNWAVFISFEDRVRWVFKSPHVGLSCQWKWGRSHLQARLLRCDTSRLIAIFQSQRYIVASSKLWKWIHRFVQDWEDIS